MLFRSEDTEDEDGEYHEDELSDVDTDGNGNGEDELSNLDIPGSGVQSSLSHSGFTGNVMQDRPGNNPVLSSGTNISPISDGFAPMGREFRNNSTGPILFFHHFTNRLRCFRHSSQSRRFDG